ncbi:translocation protein TolB precursor [Actinobacillus pleuropneumoniae]|uniref:translocation protein TolB precursor n=1 Tax=Actinobacillus pleuropneumoniae TaxID=715 RepID=UPI0005B20433|nr:translocation protein TolB precursor [Actinobacillus pleuropneumoniae]UKH11375.1 translocation protein TolB precursor [Actinobacillus pleuropneumoniae]
MYNLKVRCSQLHQLMSEPRSKADKDAGKISDTAKNAVREIAKFDLFGYHSFDGNKYTEKGNQLEDQAIKLSGFTRGLVLKKNTERRENAFITGECDIYVPSRKLIIDTKCSWDIGTHPFFQDEAEEKAKKAGYNYQMQGYMWLWDCEEAQIDFVLFPTPLDQIPQWQEPTKYVDLVEQIPIKKRITTVTIKRDEKVIAKIQERVSLASAYYDELIKQMG